MLTQEQESVDRKSNQELEKQPGTVCKIRQHLSGQFGVSVEGEWHNALSATKQGNHSSVDWSSASGNY